MGISGWGVFAAERITKNTHIVEYTGERISHQESARRERRQLARGHIWCFTVNRRWVVDGEVHGNIARYINHACRPNCYAMVRNGEVWICAARTIAPGDELTYDYHTQGAAEILCRCRPECPTRL